MKAFNFHCSFYCSHRHSKATAMHQKVSQKQQNEVFPPVLYLVIKSTLSSSVLLMVFSDVLGGCLILLGKFSSYLTETTETQLNPIVSWFLKNSCGQFWPIFSIAALQILKGSTHAAVFSLLNLPNPATCMQNSPPPLLRLLAY